MKNIFKKIEDKKIPKKNYYIVLIVSVLVIVFSLYFRSLYLKYNTSKIESGIFYNKAINQINTQDFNFAMIESNEAIMYVSYTGDKNIDIMENRLFKEIEKLNISDKIIYWNVTDLMQNKEFIGMLRNKFPSVAVDINTVPLLIYIEDGQAIKVEDSSKKMIDYKTLQDIVNKYEIE